MVTRLWATMRLTDLLFRPRLERNCQMDFVLKVEKAAHWGDCIREAHLRPLPLGTLSGARWCNLAEWHQSCDSVERSRRGIST
eukprot:7856101-Pyramimonas_sp.AAC.2